MNPSPMRWWRRRPTLEVHVPVRPTPTFLNMAHEIHPRVKAEDAARPRA
ncbi:MAG: hypothetical protein ACREKH_11155 [Candidatus Rokuibacteriota bacterium]